MSSPRLSFAAPFPSVAPTLKAVKVCGVVSPEDAEMVVAAAKQTLPADVDFLIGMILWPQSRRSVSNITAKEISTVAARSGARPVAVFVDETLSEMNDTCREIGVEVAQLHGPKCRSHWSGDTDETQLEWIDVRDVTTNGAVLPPTLSSHGPALWSLFDTKGGGTGKAFDWNLFKPPEHPWLLAGGLDPDNIEDAVRFLKPNGVDVASGVTYPDKCRKDEERVYKFLTTLVRSYSEGDVAQ
ncbi:Phosphoribosylanthranilate isomerase [Gracilaria domingensis]|nr:Phosphoribosylanthranilate isomerase [Gracilaria domingensis]